MRIAFMIDCVELKCGVGLTLECMNRRSNLCVLFMFVDGRRSW